MENNKELVFFILREKSEDISKDFADFIYALKDSHVFMDVISDSTTSITLSGQNTYKSRIDYLQSEKPEMFAPYSFCLQFTVGVEDYVTFGKIRQFLARQHQDYRVYSQQMKCLLPNDPDLVALEFGSGNIKVFDILKSYCLKAIYLSQEHQLFYAQDNEGRVRIVNPFLLDYVIDKNIPEKELGELSYPVAPSLSFFSAMYDKALIPTDFYEYYGKSTKIINYSGFNIENPGRKVFVKPYIFEFDDKKGNFYTYSGPDGGSLLVMSKILQGENLEGTIKRVLREELKNIADDFMAAAVAKKVEFDRDRDGILTPRIVVYVYVDKINDKQWATQMSQTGWKSMNGNMPKVNPNPEFKKED